MSELWQRWTTPDAGGILEILALAILFYYIILFFRGTRGASILTGLGILLVILYITTEVFHLDALNWLLTKLSSFLVLAVLIIFQPEIRRALAELGKQHRFSSSAAESKMVEAVVQSMCLLAERKIGALVAIEREIGTRSVQETGTRIESPVSMELLSTLFYPNTPLHDGGVIIADNQIMAAGCLFPLSQREGLASTLGMRHRAGLGMSEESDALIIVVSEETGKISVAYKGHLSVGFSEDRLRKLLNKVLLRGPSARRRLSLVKQQLDLTPEAVAKSVEFNAEQGPSHAG